MTSFCMGLISRKLYGFLLMFLTVFNLLCFTSFFSINQLPCLYAQFLILFHLTRGSLDQPSAAFVFGDFKVHHKDWLTYSGVTDRPGELCYNFCQMTQWCNLTF